MKTIFLLVLTLKSAILLAQIQGVVKDSLTEAPIPYVSIWVENENTGATSEENGTFKINHSGKNKNLIFSALGYEKKKVTIKKEAVILLKPTIFQLDEIVLFNKKETRTQVIGIVPNETAEAFDNGPKIDAKYFPYFKKYQKTKFIKQVSLFTDCRINKATIKIHFYSVDADGFPGKELLNKDLIVSVSKGTKETFFDISFLNLILPKTGLFVGYEKLIIESNKSEFTTPATNNNGLKIQIKQEPLVLYNWVENETSFSFVGGKWTKKNNSKNKEVNSKSKGYEPAIKLILTN